MLKEPLGLRTARATIHLRATLMAGFTTIRDLGTEGAGYADVGLKQAIEQGIIPGPRMLVVDARDRRDGQLRAEGLSLDVERPAGRRGSRRLDRSARVRDQIGHGADWVKVYADYRWGPNGEAMPTFSLEELKRRRRRPRRAAAGPWRRTRRRAEGHAARDHWRASRRSSTATTARPRCSS